MNDGYHRLPPGKIAAVVTYLEMMERPQAVPVEVPSGLSLTRASSIDTARYRDLFRRIGQDWLWFSRLSLSDAALGEILHDPQSEVHVLRREGVDIGLLELDFRKPPECELAFLGLTADAIGTGAGRFLIETAITKAFAHTPAISRLFVHTCTLDHPGALAFYRRAGFRPYARAVEIADDPRLDGRLPPDAAAWLPVL